MSLFVRKICMLCVGVTVLVLQGCASVPHPDARDPWESMNRSVYNFNEALDTAAIKPAAKAYKAVLPSPVRTGIHNFLGNLGDVWTMANSALQLKGQATVETFMRITVNTLSPVLSEPALLRSAAATRRTLRGLLTKPAWNHLEVRTLRGVLSTLAKGPRESE